MNRSFSIGIGKHTGLSTKDETFLTLMVLFSFKLVALSNYLVKVQKL